MVMFCDIVLYKLFLKTLFSPQPEQSMFLSITTSSKNMFFYSNTLDSFERIPQSVHMKTTPIHIHIQNQSIISYPVNTLVMPFFLQDCYKNRVSFWCSHNTFTQYMSYLRCFSHTACAIAFYGSIKQGGMPRAKHEHSVHSGEKMKK